MTADSLAVERAPRVVSRPRPGWFRLRLVKGGVWCAARIWLATDAADPLTGEALERPAVLLAEVGDQPCDVDRVWLSGREISEAEYHYLRDAAAWDRANAPASPAANPREAISLNDLPSLF
jgi:hypothetical protein